ncbi:transposase [Archangium primigenium]|nr:transposase [Archangium primigenium]
MAQAVPRNRGTVLSMIGALSLDGLETVMMNEGATTGDVFLHFVSHYLLTMLRPGDIVLLDRAGAHFRKEAIALIEQHGGQVLYLPPYSPDLNPIEFAWSKLKGLLRTAEARTVTALRQAVEDAMLLISASDAAQWFKACGFQPQAT